ncbi:MAG: pyruvate dehydrogenase complex dihydrolipoamide acetyltransferase [Alphaproteobacteria bacterium]|nr:pyruvate dehydrogenase complex dihydrolipoamide acetyltransferase [Alphaproteobacteria bacterium]
MTIQILMPALSPTMTEGSVSAWLKSVGDSVTAGDVIAEIETDKATMEIEAVDEGVLGRILIPAGTEGIAVNTPIAVLLEEGEDESALAASAAPAAPVSPGPTPAAVPPIPPAALTAPPTGAATTVQKAMPTEEGRIFASPLARRMAAQAGLDLSAIAGSGPHGRIVRADIEAAISGGVAAPAAKSAAALSAAPAATVEIPGLPEFELQPLNNMRKTIARRLVEAKQTIPHFYLSIDCEVDRLLQIREDLNERSPDGGGAYKLSVNDFVIRAAALALRQVPGANASFAEDGIRLYRWVDISVAVAIDGGLITPIIHRADGKGLAQISNEMKDLAAKARDGKLMPEEYQGGTFSVSNLGMFGIKHFEAVINSPQGCILAVGAGEQRPVVKDGALAVATVMTCTLSVDHRVVDGALGAQFLAAFKQLIEDPVRMLL